MISHCYSPTSRGTCPGSADSPTISPCLYDSSGLWAAHSRTSCTRCARRSLTAPYCVGHAPTHIKPTDYQEVAVHSIRKFVERVKSEADEAGQTTAEYALVILGSAAIATLLLTWASKSGGITKLFDMVVGRLIPG
ncbi:MAG: DUF4244 domain-containing protein [Actinobacteria bacterium]|nr:DUF4244 domain-containing protein [Actinomycetota bacterium]